MARKKNKGPVGGGGVIGGIISLAMIGVVLAILQSVGVSTVDDAASWVKTKANHYSKCIPTGECGLMKVVDNLDLSTVNNKPIVVDLPPIGQGGININSKGNGLIINPDGKDITVNPSGDGINASSSGTGLIVNPSGSGLVGNSSFNLTGHTIDRNVKGYQGPAKGEPYVNNAGLVKKNTVDTMLEKLSVVSDKESKQKAKEINYSRREWKHWISTERSCWNTREEVLNRDAVPGTIKYIDKHRKPTKDYLSACAIADVKKTKDETVIDSQNSGVWICPYSGKKITDVSKVDIDHVIPLSNAARNGGQAWTLAQKEAFANDPDNLLATSAKENRSKGDKGPGQYMPPLKLYGCNYAKTYITLSYKYNLTITETDKDVLEKTLKSCQH